MGSSDGDEFSFPVTNNAQLEMKLLELPKTIRNLELSIINFRKTSMESFVKAETIRNRLLAEVASNPENTNDTKRKSALNELLDKNLEYQEFMKSYRVEDNEIKVGEVELRFLNNTFEALNSISRMI